jgi:hypothetical protein
MRWDRRKPGQRAHAARTAARDVTDGGGTMMTQVTTAKHATRQIGESTGFSTSTHYIMAALLGAAAIAAIIAFEIRLNFDPNSPDFSPIIGVPFFLGAFALKSLYTAVRGTLLARRFGESTLEMEGESVPLGGTLKGRVRTSAPLTVTGDYAVTLTCIEQLQVSSMSSSTKSRIEDRVHWEGLRKVPAATVNSAEGIPFEFPIPEEALAMPDARAKGAVRWTLEVTAPQKGLDYYALFGVIVRAKGI